MSENVNITEAKMSLKHHVKFFESLLKHIRKGEEPMLSRSMWATWCLHRYIEDRLMDDIKKVIYENSVNPKQ
jgi:hypothetical protein